MTYHTLFVATLVAGSFGLMFLLAVFTAIAVAFIRLLRKPSPRHEFALSLWSRLAETEQPQVLPWPVRNHPVAKKRTA